MAMTSRSERVQQRKSAMRMVAERRVRRQRFVKWSAVLGVVLVVVLAGSWLARSLGDDGSTGSGGGMYEGLAQNGMVLGDPDAPVTLVEYADYLCPHCAEFAKNDQSKLIADFVKTGKVNYEYRPMPVLGGDVSDPDNMAVKFAEASMCALDQGKFWEFHDLAFVPAAEGQRENISEAYLQEIAGKVGLDETEFATCLSEGTHRQAVLDSYNEGAAQGISGVPSFFLDGQMVPWTAAGYDAFAQQLNSMLQQ
jgi:protein-disulfide isomerase